MKKQDMVNDGFKPKKKNLKKVMELGKNKFTEKTLDAMRTCGSYLEFIATFDKEKKKLVHGDFCKNRFCPICAWRKARKDALMLSIMMKANAVETEYKYILITIARAYVKAD